MDLFSILLLGVLLFWFLMDGAGPAVLEDHYAKFAGAQGWVACCSRTFF